MFQMINQTAVALFFVEKKSSSKKLLEFKFFVTSNADDFLKYLDRFEKFCRCDQEKKFKFSHLLFLLLKERRLEGNFPISKRTFVEFSPQFKNNTNYNLPTFRITL